MNHLHHTPLKGIRGGSRINLQTTPKIAFTNTRAVDITSGVVSWLKGSKVQSRDRTGPFR